MGISDRILEQIKKEVESRSNSLDRKLQFMLGVCEPLDENVADKLDTEINIDEWRDISAMYMTTVKLVYNIGILEYLVDIHNNAENYSKKVKNNYEFIRINKHVDVLYSIFKLAVMRKLELENRKDPEDILFNRIKNKLVTKKQLDFYSFLSDLLQDYDISSEFPFLQEYCIDLTSKLSQEPASDYEVFSKFCASETLRLLENAYYSSKYFD